MFSLALTQHYQLKITSLNSSISVLNFEVSEALNQPYQINVEFTSEDNDLPLSQLIDKAAQFSISPANNLIEQIVVDDARIWHGVINGCQRLKTSADQTHYKCILQPRLARLSEFNACRLFQNQTTPQIIEQLLRHHGFTGTDFRILTTRDYVKREYCTQYSETDLDFLTRLLEDEGLWYRFDNKDGKEIVVIGDNLEHYQRSQRTIDYREDAGLESTGVETISQLSVSHQPAYAKVKLNDYNYRSASADLIAEATSQPKDLARRGEHYSWGEHYKTQEQGKLLAQIRQQAQIAQQIQAQATGNVIDSQPGWVFQTAPAFAEAKHGWLITSITHTGARDQAYANQFSAIPADVVYRPLCNTAWAKIKGSLPARVVSPGEYQYAYLDDKGRYRVRLPFDLDQWSPGGDSRAVRLAKPYAGGQYGQHFPLHEGTEVMLSFVDGDPDRPYISGVMHDSEHADHIDNQWNTRNVIRTWANNKLRMEDMQGQQHIKLATDYAKSQLNIGHLVDGQRKKRGEGFEVRTDDWGSVRAGKGLLLSADAQAQAAGEQLDMKAAIAQLEQAISLAKSMDQAAQTAKSIKSQSPEQQKQLERDLTQFKAAGIIQTAPSGIASTTPQCQLHAAGAHQHLVSGKDTNLSAGANATIHAANNVALFAQSKGAKLQANQGKVEIQAQHNEMHIESLNDLFAGSSEGKTIIAAKEEILITSGGAYIKIKDGQIELGCPTTVRIKAMGLPIEGPATMNIPLPKWTYSEIIHPISFNFKQSPHSGLAMIGMPYQLFANGEKIQEGEIDKNGQVIVEHYDHIKKYKVILGNGHVFNIAVADKYMDGGKRSYLSNKGFYHKTEEDKQWAEMYQKIVHGKITSQDGETD